MEGNPEEFKFEENEAYSIDIVMSTGEVTVVPLSSYRQESHALCQGHLRPSELKTTVFQRNVGHQYKACDGTFISVIFVCYLIRFGSLNS